MDKCCNDHNKAHTTQERLHTLSGENRTLIREEVARLYNQAAGTRASDPPAVHFDLKGRAAGQWRLRKNTETLRFNPEAFSLDWNQHFPETVAHEVAHSLVYRTYGARRVRPHGPEWRGFMQAMGFQKPRVTHATALTTRKMRQYNYECACGPQLLSARRHFLIRKRGYHYQCRQCGEWLKRSDDGAP
ncbi:SprT-like domain-containing protein [Thioalkalivibrio sp. AKL7]|uniref:SprT family zinc-dependent metalloprotease n=1 Tax=Thioalkalivibrio sp. AKL7 TaxID=1158155 RepID=UPI0009DA50D8|nr:SprT-like domain-containing protein [Thioalkalivibrio sp. AKL7]